MLLQEGRWLAVGVGIGLLLALEAGCGGRAAEPEQPCPTSAVPDAGAPALEDAGDVEDADAAVDASSLDASFGCSFADGGFGYVIASDAGAPAGCSELPVDKPDYYCCPR